MVWIRSEKSCLCVRLRYVYEYFSHLVRAFRSVVDRLLCMLKVKGSNPLMSTLLFLHQMISFPIKQQVLDRKQL
jgi:hypothetical protein